MAVPAAQRRIFVFRRKGRLGVDARGVARDPAEIKMIPKGSVTLPDATFHTAMTSILDTGCAGLSGRYRDFHTGVCFFEK